MNPGTDHHDAPDHDAPNLHRLALALHCETCGAEPRVWCHTRTGRPATHLHAARTLVVQAVYILGYDAGARSSRNPTGDDAR